MTVGAAKQISVAMTIDADGHMNYTSVYEVMVTDPLDTPNDISIASGLPLYGDAFTFGSGGNPDAWCNGKAVEPIMIGDTNLKRKVTATFTTKPSGRARSGNNVVTNPLQEPWRASGSYVLGTRVTNIDKDGDPVLTTGLEPKYFDVPDGYDTLNLEGPSATLSLSQRAQAIARCNSAAIWGLTARQVFLARWDYDVLFAGPLSYFYHRLEFHIKYAKWNESWLNEGTQEYVSTNPVGKRIVPIIASNDSLARQVKFLDSVGRVLPETSIPAGVVTNTSELITEFDFTALTGSIGLPNPLPGNFV